MGKTRYASVEGSGEIFILPETGFEFLNDLVE